MLSKIASSLSRLRSFRDVAPQNIAPRLFYDEDLSYRCASPGGGEAGLRYGLTRSAAPPPMTQGTTRSSFPKQVWRSRAPASGGTLLIWQRVLAFSVSATFASRPGLPHIRCRCTLQRHDPQTDKMTQRAPKMPSSPIQFFFPPSRFFGLVVQQPVGVQPGLSTYILDTSNSPARWCGFAGSRPAGRCGLLVDDGQGRSGILAVDAVLAGRQIQHQRAAVFGQAVVKRAQLGWPGPAPMTHGAAVVDVGQTLVVGHRRQAGVERARPCKTASHPCRAIPDRFGSCQKGISQRQRSAAQTGSGTASYRQTGCPNYAAAGVSGLCSTWGRPTIRRFGFPRSIG